MVEDVTSRRHRGAALTSGGIEKRVKRSGAADPPTRTELAIDAVWRRASDTPIPTPPTTRSRSLLDVLVSRTSDRPDDRRMYFAKHVAGVLVANEGATEAVLQKALAADDYIQAIAPGVTVADLRAFAQVYRVDGDVVPSRLLRPDDTVATILSAVESSHRHARKLTADDRTQLASRLLLEHVIRQASPTWSDTDIAKAYATIASAAKDRMPVIPMSREDVNERMNRSNGGRTFDQSRLRFREELSRALRNPKTSLFDAVDKVVPKTAFGPAADNILTHADIAAFILRDEDLKRIFTDRFESAKPAERAAMYPVLTSRVRDVFGDRISQYSVGEIAARMRRDDPVFTESMVRELAAECAESLGGTPDPADSRNFLTAVNLANTMHRIWPGASIDDLLAYCQRLGPLSPIPGGLTASDIDILSSYEFVPAWPGGVKSNPVDEQRLELERALFGELRISMRCLLETDAGALKERIATDLATDAGLGPETSTAIRAAFRSAAVRSLMDYARDEHRSWNRHEGVRSALVRTNVDLDAGRNLRGRRRLPEHARTALETWSRVIDFAATGRGDELLLDQSWAAWMDGKERNHIVGVVDRFRAAERDVLHSVELHALNTQRIEAAFANYQKVPLAMGITQGVVEAARRECTNARRSLPLENARVVMVQHELGQAYPQVEAYRQLGMDPRKCIFIGKPYHPNPEVESTLLKVSGIDGRFLAQGALTDMKRATERAIDDAFAARAGDERILIVCDGPYAREYAERKYLSQDPGLAEFVRFTEQTAIGHRGDELKSTSKRVVSYARHMQKIIEAPYIARAGVRAIQNVLNEARETLENKTVFVKGIGGPIGRATAEALLAIGVNVVGQDISVDDELRAWAKSQVPEIKLATKPVHGTFMVVGCAGATTIDDAQIDGDMQRGDGGPCYYVSMSSELVEIDMSHIEQRATTDDGEIRRVLFAMVNDQPTYSYVLDDGSIRTVMAGGLPVNFQDVNSLAPETIDATMAMSVAAAVEAMEGDELGFFGLSRFGDVIEAGYKDYLDKHASVV